ncbi:phage major capsid protein, P2 family [Iodobacter ciconiae]|uniref:Phage major capsid protein, P2 family n=1 Tax=Iodobacter ciconiae TaxID=2496266 RepID=A0A3S8ZPX8_9NEIS|nr:phage major capsid protein, P2 family [Iodobacter ciconiae]AZN35540.1 phage major capsid protein, P2 family [Iodobacter ciconiae]
MRNDTRLVYAKFEKQIAMLNHVGDISKTFSVDPSVQQKLEERVQLSSLFLSKVNMPGVTEQEGEKLGLGLSGTIAGRTNTKKGPRKPRDISDLSSGRYRCVQTNFDTGIGYNKIDMWAKFPDFQARLRNMIVNQQALDRIMIGLNGVSAAEETDREKFPLLQDVNKGWLQQYRDNAPAHVMAEGKKAGSGKITVGATTVRAQDGTVKKVEVGDYLNLDALVFDAVNNLIHPQFRENPQLVVITSSELLADKYFPKINKDHAPTEEMAMDMLISQKRVGGISAVTVPFFPKGAVMITPLSNLSLYWQIGGRRRHVKEEPDYNQIANYESSNDAYAVEVYEAGCLIENIELLPSERTEAQGGG